VFSTLHDKRKGPCYAARVARYTALRFVVQYIDAHVCSAVSARVGAFVLNSRLCRFSIVGMERETIPAVSAECMRTLLHHGHVDEPHTLHRVCRRFGTHTIICGIQMQHSLLN
jgi:hypothetical protein